MSEQLLLTNGTRRCRSNGSGGPSTSSGPVAPSWSSPTQSGSAKCGVSVSIIRALCEVPTTRTTYFLALGKSGQTAPRDVKEIQAAEWVDLETALELLKDDGPWWAEYNIQALKLAFGIP